jgi:flagellar biosynthesis protein FliQ
VLALSAVMVIAGPWMLGQLETYTQALYSSIPDLVGP